MLPSMETRYLITKGEVKVMELNDGLVLCVKYRLYNSCNKTFGICARRAPAVLHITWKAPNDSTLLTR